MSRVTIYVMQPYWQAPKRLAAGTPMQFRDAAAARRAGERALRRNAGVVVYSVTGSPEFEIWSEPHVIARLGQVPA